jgi:hypothetical protein
MMFPDRLSGYYARAHEILIFGNFIISTLTLQ